MCYPTIKMRIKKQNEGKKVPEYRTLHAIADAHARYFRDAFLAAVKMLLPPDIQPLVIEAIDAGNYERAESLIDFETFQGVLLDEITQATEKVVESAANNSVKYFPPTLATSAAAFAATATVGGIAATTAAAAGITATTAYAFRLANPFVQDYIRVFANQLVVEITEQTRSALTEITRRAFAEGLTVKEQADMIFNTVGLYTRLSNAVLNYRSGLIGSGVTGKKLENLVQRKYNELLTYRANMIARTETITASNAGQYLVYQQAVQDNLAHTDTLMKRWIVTPDDFLCQYCKELGKQGYIPWDQAWTSSRFGSVRHPTLHPHCRCAVAFEVFLK